MSDLRAFGKRLRRLREKKELSQQELADAVSTSKSMISAYENAVSDPRQSIVVKLAKALQVSSEELLTGSISQRPSLPKKMQGTLDAMLHLNELGQTRVLEYAKALVNTKDFVKRGMKDAGTAPYGSSQD